VLRGYPSKFTQFQRLHYSSTLSQANQKITAKQTNAGFLSLFPLSFLYSLFSKSGPIQSNYLELIWTQELKWVPAWVGIGFGWGCFGLNCAQMAPGKVESDFSLQD